MVLDPRFHEERLVVQWIRQSFHSHRGLAQSRNFSTRSRVMIGAYLRPLVGASQGMREREREGAPSSAESSRPSEKVARGARAPQPFWRGPLGARFLRSAVDLGAAGPMVSRQAPVGRKRAFDGGARARSVEAEEGAGRGGGARGADGWGESRREKGVGRGCAAGAGACRTPCGRHPDAAFVSPARMVT